MKHIIIALTIGVIYSLDCSTPTDCYNMALAALTTARSDFNDAKDKVYNITGVIEVDIGGQIKDQQVKLNKTDTDLNTQSQRIVDITNSITPTINNTFDRIKGAICRDASTACQEGGKGNVFYLDRQFTYCNANEFMRGWQLYRCSDQSQIRIQYSCCSHP
jgi:hypothetical protein